jgi:hypothetical protein
MGILDMDDPSMYRPDGSRKMRGYLGMLDVGDGRMASEYSVGVNINGKEMDVPSLVPTLTLEEVKQVLEAARTNTFPPQPIIEKAAAHAKERLKSGKSPFWGTLDSVNSEMRPNPRPGGILNYGFGVRN